MEVREERTGWRDHRIGLRHRSWGWDCPAADIDFLMIEYDRGKAKALVEYKHELANEVRVAHPSIRAIVDLADRAGLPAFVVRYAGNFSWWYPTPINDAARTFLSEPRHLSEEQWVELLYRIRGRSLPPEWRRRA